MADKNNCRMLTGIPVKDWIGCPATIASLSALVGAIVPRQLRKLGTVFEVVGLQVLGISSVKTDADVWLIDSCVKCKKAAPCKAEHPTFVMFFFVAFLKIFLILPNIDALLTVRLIQRTVPRSTSLWGSHSQIATASAPCCSTTNWCCNRRPAWIACYPTRCTTLWQCACSCATCSGGHSGFADSLSVKMIISKLWSWSAVICSRVGGPAERALSSSLVRCSGKTRTASWTLAVPWHLWTCCRSMSSWDWFVLKWKLVSCEPWWPSMTCSWPMMKLSSKTTQPSRRCGWRDLWIACCLVRARQARRTRQSCGALVPLRRSIGCCEAVRAKRTWSSWPTPRQMANGACSGTCRSMHTLWQKPRGFWCSRTSQRWVPHRRPGMDTNETTRQRRRAGAAGRDNDGGGRRLSV